MGKNKKGKSATAAVAIVLVLVLLAAIGLLSRCSITDRVIKKKLTVTDLTADCAEVAQGAELKLAWTADGRADYYAIYIEHGEEEEVLTFTDPCASVSFGQAGIYRISVAAKCATDLYEESERSNEVTVMCTAPVGWISLNQGTTLLF